MEQMLIYFTLGCAALAILYGVITRKSILALPAGTEKMQEIASAIEEGAKAYMNRQYTTIAVTAVVLVGSRINTLD